MIKNTEVRIGNFVYDVDKDIHREILEINRSHVFFKGGGCGLFETMTPIELTEEWLIKFGFLINRQTKEENDIWRCNWTEGHFEVEQIIGFYLWDNSCYGTEIKYVHQLQNLYFALTGEELEIKNK